ncbi:MAG: hypothetical protein ACI4TE_03725 [Alphaproteobacteria bacterium]
MMNVSTTLPLIKQAFLFVLNFKRLLYLTAVPCAAAFVVLLAEASYPLFSLAETAEVKLIINFYMLGFLVVFFLFFFLSLVRHVQQIVFFGEAVEKKKFFAPFPDKSFFVYFRSAIYVFINALIFSVISAYLLLTAVNYFLPLPQNSNLYMLLGTAVILPYFMIRFSFVLPASAAGKKLRFWDSWKLTRRISPMIAMALALFLLLPLGIAAGLYTLAQNMIENTAVVNFITNFCSLLSLMFSSVLFAAYSAYLYSAASEQS